LALEQKQDEDRVDITEVKIDMTAPAEQRAEQYLSQIKNPYAFRCGDTFVNLAFNADGKSLKQAVVSYLTARKSGG
jgi:hypothetical protein